MKSKPSPSVAPIEFHADKFRFKKLALRGVTVFVSTGDIGVGRDGQCCAAPRCSDLKYTNHGGHFIKRFPAVCPYVVAVGMTQMKPGASFEDPEIAGFSDTRFSSGGGFSDHFDMPEWQRGAVNAYLAEHGSRYTAYTFNRNGRAFPDISANGRCHPIVYYENQDTCYSGTSVSAPLVASMFTLINNERIVRGMPVVVSAINPNHFRVHAENIRDTSIRFYTPTQTLSRMWSKDEIRVAIQLDLKQQRAGIRLLGLELPDLISFGNSSASVRIGLPRNRLVGMHARRGEMIHECSLWRFSVTRVLMAPIAAPRYDSRVMPGDTRAGLNLRWHCDLLSWSRLQRVEPSRQQGPPLEGIALNCSKLHTK